MRVNFSHIRVSTLGYKTLDIPVELGNINKLNIKMVPSYITLNEVIVKPKKEKYSKKNNPAVEFARKLIEHRETGDPLETTTSHIRNTRRLPSPMTSLPKTSVLMPSSKVRPTSSTTPIRQMLQGNLYSTFH